MISKEDKNRYNVTYSRYLEINITTHENTYDNPEFLIEKRNSSQGSLRRVMNQLLTWMYLDNFTKPCYHKILLKYFTLTQNMDQQNNTYSIMSMLLSMY